MSEVLFCQLDYPEELGTKDPNGQTITIAACGCALCATASMLNNVFGFDIDPLAFNKELSDNNGFASNGAGDFDILNWETVAEIGELTLNFNKTYYNPPAGNGQPADMAEIDALLEKGFSVIAGVSFNHNPQEPTPTHYVEIYRKNDDNTYQMRDPMFHGSENDTVYDARYAVNGMTVAESILQVVSFTGDLPAAEEVTPPANTKYKVGDASKVYSAVPTGASPDTIGFSYGQVSPIAPAVVIGFLQKNNDWFYDVDQTSIGGGTGFARVEDIDKASIAPATAPATTGDNKEETATETTSSDALEGASTSQDDVTTQPTAPASQTLASVMPPTAPDEQIKQLSTEKGNLATQLDTANKKYNNDLERYQEFVAAGYEKIEDVVKKIEDLTSVNRGLKKHIKETLTNNEALHEMLANRDNKDATAIDEGIKYEYLYKDVQGDMAIIAKLFKTRPYRNDILSAADKIKSAYDKIVKQLKQRNIKEAAQTAEEVANTVVNTEEQDGAISGLNKIFNFSWLKKGV